MTQQPAPRTWPAASGSPQPQGSPHVLVPPSIVGYDGQSAPQYFTSQQAVAVASPVVKPRVGLIVTMVAGTEQPAAVHRDESSVAGVAARVLPGVIAIQVETSQGEGVGSGFIFDANGHIVTNNHVVEGSNSSITVVFEDGRRAPAAIVGKDPTYDLAVIKADVGDREPLAVANSDSVVVGDPVIAIGAPLGLQGTVTTGIVSAKNRAVVSGKESNDTPESYMNAIQTDAAINPGNSGGPLVNGQGTVVGVNTMIAQLPSQSGGGVSGSIGLGFAIPSNQVQRTAEQIIRTGNLTASDCGCAVDPRG